MYIIMCAGVTESVICQWYQIRLIVLNFQSIKPTLSRDLYINLYIANHNQITDEQISCHLNAKKNNVNQWRVWIRSLHFLFVCVCTPWNLIRSRFSPLHLCSWCTLFLNLASSPMRQTKLELERVFMWRSWFLECHSASALSLVAPKCVSFSICLQETRINGRSY
jgi:hypothetical protein